MSDGKLKMFNVSVLRVARVKIKGITAQNPEQAGNVVLDLTDFNAIFEGTSGMCPGVVSYVEDNEDTVAVLVDELGPGGDEQEPESETWLSPLPGSGEVAEIKSDMSWDVDLAITWLAEALRSGTITEERLRAEIKSRTAYEKPKDEE